MEYAADFYYKNTVIFLLLDRKFISSAGILIGIFPIERTQYGE